MFFQTVIPMYAQPNIAAMSNPDPKNSKGSNKIGATCSSTTGLNCPNTLAIATGSRISSLQV